MSPKGHFDLAGAEALIDAAKQYQAKPPGSVEVHHDSTGFFRYVYEEETGVLDGLRDYMKDMPSCNPKFFR
ncbi:MAG: glutaconyl-CoA decarboxylase subunit alpha, partial [Desulfobacula sp.]|nr:glutaconyl-CoA decarboxylase subunit alpha [Desulfobacula sp.]